MAAFKGGIGGAAPLQIQLNATTKGLEVLSLFAAGESTIGAASRPVVSRPATPGTGSGLVVPISESSPVSTAQITTAFSSAPTLPYAPTGAFNLPLRVRWAAGVPGTGYVVYPGGVFLFYAASTGGHLWSGEIMWEER